MIILMLLFLVLSSEEVKLTSWGQYCHCAYSFINSFSMYSLSCDRSIASSKASLPHSAIECFQFQILVSSLFLAVIQQPITSSASSSWPVYCYFNQVLYEAVTTQDMIHPVRLYSFTVCRLFLSSSTLCNTSLFCPCSDQLIFSSTTFQNFQGIYDVFFQVSKLQHHIKLCLKCSISLVSSLNLSSVRLLLFLLNAAFAVVVLHFISCVHITSRALKLAK